MIRNARIVDGGRARAFVGDVPMSGERIAEKGAVEERRECEMDPSCFVLAPGFIDVHPRSGAISSATSRRSAASFRCSWKGGQE